MTPTKQLDVLAVEICQMDRPNLVHMLREMKCTFNLDFSDQYLNSLGLDNLRHVVLGACMHKAG